MKRLDALISYALAFPEAWEDHPWGETAIKVGKKAFVFLFGEGGAASMTVKLPDSAGQALLLPGANPTGYGLGGSGWVTMPIGGREPGIAVLRDFIDESYRAVAPKRLVATLEG